MANSKVARLCKIWNCSENEYALKHCHTHWRRKREGMSSDNLDRPPRRKFRSTSEDGFAFHFWSWVKITANPEKCWEWGGYIGLNGYGVYPLDGINRRSHRIAWEVSNGRTTEMNVLHSCDNTKCVNPNHLREGAQLDNIHDMIERGRAAWQQ